MHHLIGFLRTVRFSAIGVSSPQLDEVFGFKCLKEDLLQELDFDGAISFIKTKKRMRIFRMQKGDPWSITF